MHDVAVWQLRAFFSSSKIDRALFWRPGQDHTRDFLSSCLHHTTGVRRFGNCHHCTIYIYIYILITVVRITYISAMVSSAADRAALEHGDLEDAQDLIPPSHSNGRNGAPSANGSNGHSSYEPSKSTSPLDLIITLGYRLCSAVSYVYAYVIYSYFHRRTEFVLGCILLLCTLLALSGKTSTHHGRGYHNPAIVHDWSQVQSAFDLKLGNIDHWCLRGGDDQCRCEDPLVPSARSEAKMWAAAHKHNKLAVKDAAAKFAPAASSSSPGGGSIWSSGLYGNNLEDDGIEWYEDGYQDDWFYEQEGGEGGAGNGNDYDAQSGPLRPASENTLDVVFLGDSITEQRAGKFFGKDMDKFASSAKVFTKHFSREGGSKYDGLALGIAGDTAPNLLWRIIHGEMPDDLNPRIWWITIGTNDLGATQCSEEVTLLGILRVVEEILNRKPDSHIVINSILPMSREKSGVLEVKGKKPRKGRRNRKNPTEFWPSIKAVNKQLKRFADKHKSVKFFDATDIFTEEVGNRLVIDHTLIEDGVHPTPAGYKKWDAEIIKRIDTIESKDDTKKAAKAASASDAAKASAAKKQQDDMDEAAQEEITDDEYDSYDQFGEDVGAYDDIYYDDLYYAANWEGDGVDDDWLYAGQNNDDWR